MEFAVTMSIVGAGFVLFSLAVKYLPVFPHEHGDTAEPVTPAVARLRPRAVSPVFGKAVLASLWILLFGGVAAVGYAMTSATPDPTTTVEPAPAAMPRPAVAMPQLPGEYTFPASADSPGPVTFRHASHVDPSAAACGTCHEALFRINEPGTPIVGVIDYDRVHTGDLCGSCHDGTRAFAVADDCTMCHTSQ
jgi:c(7)-type cytochrome triheme protein